MGIFDKIQDAAQQMATQQHAGSSAVTAAFPPGALVPRTDIVRVSPRFRQGTVPAYIATLGLLPEDVYAVIPEQSSDVTIAFEFVYRDRPEYEAGRRNWAAGGA